jgi:hypothetical protein
MDPEGRFRSSSETRIVVAGSDGQAIDTALEQAASHVARMAPCPSTERMAARLELLRATVRGWDATPPSEAELRAVREQVASVLQLAKASSPTVRIRRIA